MKQNNIKTVLVITTIDNISNAKSMAHNLIQNKLCACINIIPKCYSIYSWQDKIEEAEEYLLFIKTPKDKYQGLENALKSLHPYTVPEIIAVDINDGLPEYLNWVNSIIQS